MDKIEERDEQPETRELRTTPPLSRREALKRIAGTGAGIVAASLGFVQGAGGVEQPRPHIRERDFSRADYSSYSSYSSYSNYSNYSNYISYSNYSNYGSYSSYSGYTSYGYIVYGNFYNVLYL